MTKHSTFASCVVAVAVVAAMSAARAAQSERSESRSEEPASSPLPLLVKASISTAGPYGESWYLTLAPGGEANLQVFYSRSPSGSLIARFTLSEEHVLAVRNALTSEEFFALPTALEPSPTHFHRPRLVLDVYLGDRRHNVSLYDPEALGNQPSTDRFLAVWGSVFEALPLNPSW